MLIIIIDSMKSCKNIYNLLLSAVVALVAFAATFSSCTTTADYTLGEELAPSNQQMVLRHRLYSAGIITEPDKEATPCEIFETRLYKTDSITTQNMDNVYLGLHTNQRFGTRRISFAGQYLFDTPVDDSIGFGFHPVYDSATFVFEVDTFIGDTNRPVKYNVYALTGDLATPETKAEDSIFYTSYDPRKAGHLATDAEPVFTFEYPNPSKKLYTTSKSVRMKETPATKAFIDKLMCRDKLDANGLANNNTKNYGSDTTFVEAFKGLYIEPELHEPAEGEGSMFSFAGKETGFKIYGRVRNPQADADILIDSLTMGYFFKNEYSDFGAMSAQRVEYDYSTTELASLPIDETMAERAEVQFGYVDGCGGVVTELTFTDDLLLSLRTINSGDEEYVSAAINQATLRFFIEDADYNYDAMDPVKMGEKMSNSIGRLGLYTNYKSLTPVIDYMYDDEENEMLYFNGYMNRSLACYEMNISSYVQGLVNELLKLEPDSNGEIDLSKLETPRTIYLAPSANDRFTFNRSVVQGGNSKLNKASIQLELTYTLVK